MVLRSNLTDLGDGLEMGNGEEGQEGGGSWMTPRFRLAQLSGRMRWGHWEVARFGGSKIVSLSQDMLSLRNL